MDTTVEKELGRRFNITGYPTLKLFAGGKIINYEGGQRETQDFLNFISKHTEPKIKFLTSEKQLQDSISEAVISVFYLGASSMDVSESMPEFNEFKNAIQEFEDIQFYASELQLGKKQFPEITGKFGIALMRNFEEKLNIYKGEFRSPMIKEFIYDKAIPTVSPLNELILNRVFKYSDPSMFLFRNPAQHKQIEKQIEAVKRHKVCLLPSRKRCFYQNIFTNMQTLQKCTILF